MVNKEEMVNYIDKSIDLSINSLKEDLKKYIDDSIEENKREIKRNEFYEKFKSNKFFENKEALYNIDLDEIKLGDIVFGVVCGNDIEDERYPFKVIYKDNEKLILQGIKNTGKQYTFKEACKLKWDIALMVDQEIEFHKDCTIISKEIIDKYNLDSLLLSENLGIGFWYWTSTRYSSVYDSPYSSDAWYVNSYGAVYSASTSGSYGALPYAVINL